MEGLGRISEPRPVIFGRSVDYYLNRVTNQPQHADHSGAGEPFSLFTVRGVIMMSNAHGP
jgi:hypothetical protein